MTYAEKLQGIEAARELASIEIQAASDDVLTAAWDAGALPDEEREMGEAQKGRVAYFLAEGAKKRAGAWPSPEVARLQRAWDALVRLDDEASRADTAAVNDVNAEDES